MALNPPRFVADENLNNDLLRQLLRRLPGLDVVRVQDTAIAGADDPTLLAWAATAGRILITHDARTIPGYAYERVRAGLPLPGVVIVAASGDHGEEVIEGRTEVAASRDDEWPDRVRFIPLR